MNSYRKLVSSSEPEVSAKDFSDKAHICFMILDNDNNNLKKQTERYLFEHADKASTKSFQKLIRDIEGYKDKLEKFDPIFLFSNVRLAENKDEFEQSEFKFDKYKMNMDTGTKELDKI